ncbi:hypothetical protein [Mangrovicoccus sp. HB161399]|uniref:hypothetical protein n=1 Tax=Mangrovicoccus sp. HB161399 TaxID=2720392 RepID=UPI001553D668|nr:hypothetical protein [Mangrovicoccus sp. HB161399]
MPAPSLPQPPFHLRFPKPLVVDVDQALLAVPETQLSAPDPAELRLHRPALELLRLWRRFRGQIQLLTGLPQDWGLWLCEALGLRASVTCTGRRAQDKATVAMKHHGMRSFELLCGLPAAEALGPYVHRLWLIGERHALQDRLRSSGVAMSMLDGSDTVAMRDLVGRGSSGWGGTEAKPLSPLSIEANRRYRP